MQVYDERDEYEPAVRLFQACKVKSHAKVAKRAMLLLILGAVALAPVLWMRGL